MQKIWNQKDKCWESIRCLKNLSFKEQSEKKFFLHRSFKQAGFSVTELQTGSAVCQGRKSMREAIEDAKRLLGCVSKDKFQNMINQALLKQVEDEMKPCIDLFPEDRTGEPEEFREEDL